jgi:hypothetical protein
MSNYQIKRSDTEIDAVLNAAHAAADSGIPAYPGMTFEDGVAQGIEWACGIGDNEPPLP